MSSRWLLFCLVVFLSSVAVVGAQGQPSETLTCGVPAKLNHTGLTYALHGCANSSNITVSASNVALRVVGGTSFPFVSVTAVSIDNVSIFFAGIRAQNASKRWWLLAALGDMLLLSNVTVVVSNCTAVVTDLATPLLSLSARHVQDVTIQVLDVRIIATNFSSGALFIVVSRNVSIGIAMAVLRSTIHCTASVPSGILAFSDPGVVSHARTGASWHRSSMCIADSVLVLDLTCQKYCEWGLNSAIAFVGLWGRVSNLSFLSHNSTLNLTLLDTRKTQKILGIFLTRIARQSAALAAAEVPSALMWDDVHIVFTSTDIYVSSTSVVVGVLVENVALLSNSTVRVSSGCRWSFSAVGFIPQQVESRSAMLVLIRNDFRDLSLHNVSVSVLDSVGYVNVISGVTSDVAANSTLAEVSASVVSVDAFSLACRVTVQSVKVFADVRNGTIPFMIGFPISLLMVAVSVVRLQKYTAAENLVVGIDDCQLLAHGGFAVASPTMPNPLWPPQSFAASVVTLVGLGTNLTQSHISIRHSTVRLLSMVFPKTVAQESNLERIDRFGPSFSFKMYNVTTLLCSFDVAALAELQLGFVFELLLNTLPSLNSFSAPTEVLHSNITLEASYIRLPTAPLMTDVVALWNPPALVRHSVIRISECGEQDDAQVPPPHVVLVSGNSTMEHTSIAVERTFAGCMLVACLLYMQWDAVEVHIISSNLRRPHYYDSSVTSITALWWKWPRPTTVVKIVPLRQNVSVESRNTTNSSTHNAPVCIDVAPTFVVHSTTFTDFSGLLPTTSADVYDLRGHHNFWETRTTSTILSAATTSVSILGSLNSNASALRTCTEVPTTAAPSFELRATTALALAVELSNAAAFTNGGAAAVAGVSGVLGSGAAIGALQDLGAFGYSACAPPALKTASGPARYLMSPFVDGGSVAVVLGNIGVAIGFFGAHLLAVRLLARRSVVPPPEVSLKFPNTSYWVATLAMRGVAVAGVGELFSGTPSGTVVGVTAVAAVGGLFGARYRLMALPTERLFVFRAYRHAVRAAFVLPSALPLGRWGPTRLHATHGRLRGSVRPPGLRLALLPQVHSLASLVVVGLPVPRDLCHVQWAVVCVFPLCACAVVLFRRPARVPLRDVLDATRYLLSFVLCLALAVAAATDSEGTVALAAFLSCLSTSLIIINCVGLAHSVGVSRWEKRMRKAQRLFEELGDAAAQRYVGDGEELSVATRCAHVIKCDPLIMFQGAHLEQRLLWLLQRCIESSAESQQPEKGMGRE